MGEMDDFLKDLDNQMDSEIKNKLSRSISDTANLIGEHVEKLQEVGFTREESIQITMSLVYIMINGGDNNFSC